MVDTNPTAFIVHSNKAVALKNMFREGDIVKVKGRGGLFIMQSVFKDWVGACDVGGRLISVPHSYIITASDKTIEDFFNQFG